MVLQPGRQPFSSALLCGPKETNVIWLTSKCWKEVNIFELKGVTAHSTVSTERVRSCQPKVLERRRQTLEQYLQAMFRFGPSRAEVLAFLGVKKLKDSLECMDFAAEDKSMDHQPIYNYKKDPYMQVEENSNLPDVVTQGVLLGLYGNSQ
ncbi:sorting nexin-24-like isoform X3 [Zootermopsis nevadensis]|uniref:sorting nexin-24-like isoform X3 n=1 Tax=Zootermopsis nevadensis TaxID=136037 RepID=UPI000B8E7242|nr:sorting nexin-24-like isoform X3 [Zootermopsis nevadensis]